VLLRVYLQIRPFALDPSVVDRTYVRSRDILCEALALGQARQGIESALEELAQVPTEDSYPRPIVAVTGDYYTRVVEFANNEVYREIEALGGTLWSPPTFSDSVKMGSVRDFGCSVLNLQSGAALRHGLAFMMQALCEYRVNGGSSARQAVSGPIVPGVMDLWRMASKHADVRLPAGITAPIATTLRYLDEGAHGVLNLMTLNCSYGTVVTASLARAMRERQGVPMLTLVYDGLKKTNEKTRLEAFMDQVWDRFRSTPARGSAATRAAGWKAIG
jgi:hypothetical protein